MKKMHTKTKIKNITTKNETTKRTMTKILKMKIATIKISLTILTLSLFSQNQAAADTILLSMAKSIRGVKIVAFKQAKLETIDKNGNRQVFPYSDIAIIRVDGKPHLNKAEMMFLQGKFELAATEYQKVINNVSEKKRWIKIWARVKLMNIFAKLGNARRMTETYIELAKTIPDWVIMIAPTRREAKLSKKQIAIVARILAAERQKSKSTKVREAIAKFYKRMGCVRKLPTDSYRKISESIADVNKATQAGPWLVKWVQQQLSNGNIKKAYEVTNRLFKTSFRRNLPVVLYCQGRILLADEKYDQAGLKLIRLAIEFPSSQYTPAALFYAGKAAELAGRMEYAKKIWKELIDNYSSSMDFKIIDFVEKAHDALKDREYK